MQDDLRAAGAINVQDFLNQNRFSSFQWLIFGLCFLIVLLDGFDTAAIGFIAPSLIKDWGVTRQALAPVLSAALFGLSAGALLAGPLSDRVGRKLILSLSVLLFGVACAWSSFASSLTELTILCFITGLGLGAAMPNAVTLMNEYCPDGRRATLTNAMFCGFPLGAACGGFLAAWMIPQWGWTPSSAVCARDLSRLLGPDGHVRPGSHTRSPSRTQKIARWQLQSIRKGARRIGQPRLRLQHEPQRELLGNAVAERFFLNLKQPRPRRGA